MLIPIYKVKLNPNNPRSFKDSDVDFILKSILTFPEMLERLRPIVIDKNYVIQGGNLRQKALLKALRLSLNEISDIIATKNISPERVEYLVNFWADVQSSKKFQYIQSDLEEDLNKEFLIRDNVNTGEWDYDVLANEWDSNLLLEYGLDVPEMDYNSPENQENETFEFTIVCTNEEELMQLQDKLGIAGNKADCIFIMDLLK